MLYYNALCRNERSDWKKLMFCKKIIFSTVISTYLLKRYAISKNISGYFRRTIMIRNMKNIVFL